MKQLIAVPFEEYTSELSSSGVKYNIVDIQGVIYLRCVVTTRKYSDHDLVIKELPEAPSNVRVAVQQHLDTVLGRDQWKVKTRLPFNVSIAFDQRVGNSLHKDAVELQYNFIEGQVKKHKISI